MNLANVPLHVDFDDSEGRFLNFDTYDETQQAQLELQRHVDIRSFADETDAPIEMFWMDAQDMSELDTFQMKNLGTDTGPAYHALRPGDAWTVGAIGSQADRNNLRGLKVIYGSVGTHVTTSVLQDEHNAVVPIDLDTGFTDDDFISIACPAFPLGSITLAASSVQFSARPDGGFGVDPLVSTIFFTSNINTWLNGDTEFRFSRTLLFANLLGDDRTAALRNVTGVSFSVVNTVNCTFRVLAFRLIGKDWVYAPLDINTRLDRLGRPAAPDGSLSTPVAFPTALINGVTRDWPMIFWADTISGNADPRPVDITMGAAFNTGSLIVADGSVSSDFTLFLREHNGTYRRMLDLDSGTYTMEFLDSLGAQPDYTSTSPTFIGRPQSDLDVLDQSDLDGVFQSAMDHTLNPTHVAWVFVSLVWDALGTTLTIGDALQTYYSFDVPTLAANFDYFLIADVVEAQLRVQIFPLDHNSNNTTYTTAGVVASATPIFDTTVIVDHSFIKRRQGRVGWEATLLDGDACIHNIRSRGASFAELKSHPLRSVSPVDGAQIFYSGTTDNSTFPGWTSAPGGGIVDIDTVQSNSGRSFRVTTDGGPIQGIASGLYNFENFATTEIRFDINMPGDLFDASGEPLHCLLLNESGGVIQLPTPLIVSDRWTHAQINFDELPLVQNGRYSVLLLQVKPNIAGTWYVDNFFIRERVIDWSARGEVDNAWHESDGWVPFLDVANNLNGGVLFHSRQNELQIRAKALRQNVVIDDIRTVPRYAQLGRFVWPDEGPLPVDPPVAAFTSSITGNFVALDGSGSSTTDFIVLYEWDFGDGSRAVGQLTGHSYTLLGTYGITLIVTDSRGQQSTITHLVTIV